MCDLIFETNLFELFIDRYVLYVYRKIIQLEWLKSGVFKWNS